MKRTKAYELLTSLNENKILRHKRIDSLYVERAGDIYTVWRDKVAFFVGNIDQVEKIVKHHDTREWEVSHSPYSKRHPVLSMI